MENNTHTEYRNLLQKLEMKAQEQYDKTVITLSTGALSISFVFIKDIVKLDKIVFIDFLIAAWICWALSVSCVLISFYTSKQAMSKAIYDFDENIEEHNKSNTATSILNFLSGTFFVLGLIFIIIFVKKNLGV